jgi:hypothetical protein
VGGDQAVVDVGEDVDDGRSDGDDIQRWFHRGDATTL